MYWPSFRALLLGTTSKNALMLEPYQPWLPARARFVAASPSNPYIRGFMVAP